MLAYKTQIVLTIGAHWTPFELDSRDPDGASTGQVAISVFLISFFPSKKEIQLFRQEFH